MDAGVTEALVGLGILLGSATVGMVAGRRSSQRIEAEPPAAPPPPPQRPSEPSGGWAFPPPPATQSGQWGALPDHAAVLAPLDQLIERIADRVVKPIEGKIDGLAEDIHELKRETAERHQDHEKRLRAAEIAIARVGLVKRKDTPT